VNAHYKVGQTLYITVEITANHKGYYNFSLYVHPDTDGKDAKTTRDLVFYELEQVNPNMEHTHCSYHIINPTYDYCEQPGVAGSYYLEYKLPKDVECKRCVLQWHYMTGNSVDANPEEFWNCADITISKAGPAFNNERTNKPTPDGGSSSPSPTTGPVTTSATTGGTGCRCIAVNPTVTDKWCQDANCAKEYIDGGFCAWSHECEHDHHAHSGGTGYAPSDLPLSYTTTREFKPVDAKLECIKNGEYYLCKKAK